MYNLFMETQTHLPKYSELPRIEQLKWVYKIEELMKLGLSLGLNETIETMAEKMYDEKQTRFLP